MGGQHLGGRKVRGGSPATPLGRGVPPPSSPHKWSSCQLRRPPPHTLREMRPGRRGPAEAQGVGLEQLRREDRSVPGRVLVEGRWGAGKKNPMRT